MIISAELHKPREEQSFPFIGESKSNNGWIVLFDKDECGMILRIPHNTITARKVGEYYCDWAMSNFKPIERDVAIIFHNVKKG